MKTFAVLALSVAFLAGCSATPYHEGYGESRLSQTVFRISTVANGYSEIGREDDIAMLRAAEIACMTGHQSFDVINEQREQQGQISYKYLTIELKEDGGRYDARMIMRGLKAKLNTDTECSF
ncbi:MAG: CC0125/CC1285 family lipoprotein [Endozoicomonas sp.]